MSVSRLMTAFIAIAIAQAANAGDFCALTLTVVHPDGSKVSGVTVQLLDPDGNAVNAQVLEQGVVRFCDFEFGDHSIVIGDRCGTVVRGVKLIYAQEQQLSAVLNSCGSIGMVFGACPFYLRVVDESNTAVPKAEVQLNQSPPLRADGYGRIEFGVPMGHEHSVVLKKRGFAPHLLKAKCDKSTYTELKIVMRSPDRD